MSQDAAESSESLKSVPQTTDELRPLIVGVGASAGGLKALRELLGGIPPESGLTIIVVQHLDPTHESQMAALLAGHASLRVCQAEEGMAIAPNTVYTMPPGRYLSLREGRLHLESPPGGGAVRMPIDYFLRSLAAEGQERAVCVVLSGSGSDGSLGVRAVRGAGGLAIAQDPDTAEYDSMPRAALATGLVDLVLAPQEIGAAILRYAHHSRAAAAPPMGPAEGTPEALEGVLNLLLRARADFRGYKRGTLLRRIERRMGLSQAATLTSYLELLRGSPEEVTKLAKDILVGVTGFFRDPEAYEELRRSAVIPLVRASAPDRPLRVWVAGCSTGEEAYSLTMLLFEELQAAGASVPLQVFASDLDGEALAFARAGVYPESIAADVSAARLKRFFAASDHGYRISKEVRDTVIFAAHNVVADPPFSRMDLVSCRNLLIYLGPELQRRLASLFGFAVSAGGYLFLGSADSLPGGTETFAVVSSRWRLYQRTSLVRHDATNFPSLPARTAPAEPRPRAVAAPPPQPMALAQGLLLQHYAAGLVLTDAHGEILYFYGETDKYLRRPTGAPDLNLFSSAREGLPRRLRAAVRQALQEKEAVRIEQVPVKGGGGSSYVNVTVRPSLDVPSSQELVAVIFEDAQGPAATSPQASAAADGGGGTPLVGQLEAEVKAAREEERATMAEHAVAVEELRAAHEEAISMNEELRSTNEELEASKEELQSVNEELHTLNAELRGSIEGLNATTGDLTNLFTATEIATIFLDRELCIRRFTPSATALLSLLPVDVGRPVSHISQRFQGNELVAKAEQVLRDLVPVEKEVRTAEGRWYLMRLLPYRSVHDRIEGVVVTFTDVTRLKLAEQVSEEARVYAESIVATVREPLLVLDSALRVLSANPSFHRAFGMLPEETYQQPLVGLGNGLWNLPDLLQALACVIPEGRAFQDLEIEQEVPGQGRRVMLLNAGRIEPVGDRPPLVLLAIDDVTERKRVQLADAMVAEISHRTKNNLAIVAGLLQLQLDREGASASHADLIRDAVTRIMSFAALHEQMSQRQAGDVELVDAVRRIAEVDRQALAGGRVDISVEGTPVVYPASVATNLCVVANELVTNAIKHGATSDGVPRVEVRISREEGRLVLSVWNSHHPVAADFEPGAGARTGLGLVRTIVEDGSGGTFTLVPDRGGTLARVTLDEDRLLRP
jgi:two-component system, chemotaxis family, CheB/CheR fusion protein